MVRRTAARVSLSHQRAAEETSVLCRQPRFAARWVYIHCGPPVAVSERPHAEAQGAASNWSAQKVREEEAFADAFDAVGATEAGRPVMFTGESVFPWMLEVSYFV